MRTLTKLKRVLMFKVSIIIPTKNNGDILEKCFSSIQNLDYPKDEYEVIIVDRHSTDDYVEVKV